jgi:DnaJ family protein C protein 17
VSNRDPYQVLEVKANASDEEIRTAYRRLVQRHHPDHNGGSPESARRFEEVQEAYSRIRELRAAGPARQSRQSRQSRQPRGPSQPSQPSQPRPDATPPPDDPALDARLQDLERQVRRAQDRARKEAEKARERARRAAREATERARSDRPDRPSDEDLGYVTTDDSFSKILADARGELTDRFSHAREHPVVKRVSDLIDGLDDLASKLDEDRRRRKP